MKRNRVEHFYKPLSTSFAIIGATESSIFGRCFVVEASPRERTFRADGFEFETTQDRDSLWEKLHATELKRLAAVARKKKPRKRQADDDYSAREAIWNRERTWEYEPEFSDEQNPESSLDSETVDPEIIEVS